MSSAQSITQRACTCWLKVGLMLEDGNQNGGRCKEHPPELQVPCQWQNALLVRNSPQVVVAEVGIIEGQKGCERCEVADVHAQCLAC